MERLTEKIGNTNCVKGCGSNCKYGFQHCRTEDWENCKTIDDVINKIAEYEDLEDNGLLLRLPCKVGDTVWELDEHKNITECKVVLFGFDLIGELYMFYDSKDGTFRSKEYISSFGKTVFLTQTEAEQKLKEMESD